MQITEKWIGEAAGGRVFREARALVKLGKISQLKQRDGGYQAIVGSGEKPLRVVVKVTSRTEVKNLCPCHMSRRTGAMCEHAAAVLMATVLQPKEESKETTVGDRKDAPVPELIPLDVQLSPRFPDEGLRAIQLKKSGRSDSETLSALISIPSLVISFSPT